MSVIVMLAIAWRAGGMSRPSLSRGGFAVKSITSPMSEYAILHHSSSTFLYFGRLASR